MVGINVSTLIAELGARHGARTALVDLSGDRPVEITYERLVESTTGLARALHGAGVRRGDRVAVALDNSIEMVTTEWSCLIAGFVWVALNVRSSSGEIAEVLSDCRPSVVITNERHRESVVAAASPQSSILVVGSAAWGAFLEAAAVDVALFTPAAPDPVRIRYTSGTSGRAKGAILSRAGYDASLEIVSEVIGPLDADDVVAQVAPMTHASGAMLLPHLAVGARAVLIDGFDAPALIEYCTYYRVTAMFLVPTMLIRFLDAIAEGDDLSSLRTIVYGGASIPAETIAAAVERLGPIFVQIYGLTESTWPVCALRRDEHVRARGESRERWLTRLASCGRPTAVGDVRVVGDGGKDVADGESGELWVRGRNTMTGYWGAGDAEGKGLDRDGWMHTGDIGVRDADGRITIVDRLYDMIVSGGFNIYPREVEDALASHEAVLESAVVGRPHSQWGEAVHACVVVKPGVAATVEELMEHVAVRVAGYKKPKTLEFIDELPKNASGKILRRVLRERP